MLSERDNNLFTRVGPGTPMGELIRRFWIPGLLLAAKQAIAGFFGEQAKALAIACSLAPEPSRSIIRVDLISRDFAGFP